MTLKEKLKTFFKRNWVISDDFCEIKLTGEKPYKYLPARLAEFHASRPEGELYFLPMNQENGCFVADFKGVELVILESESSEVKKETVWEYIWHRILMILVSLRILKPEYTEPGEHYTVGKTIIYDPENSEQQNDSAKMKTITSGEKLYAPPDFMVLFFNEIQEIGVENDCVEFHIDKINFRINGIDEFLELEKKRAKI